MNEIMFVKLTNLYFSQRTQLCDKGIHHLTDMLSPQVPSCLERANILPPLISYINFYPPCFLHNVKRSFVNNHGYSFVISSKLTVAVDLCRN